MLLEQKINEVSNRYSIEDSITAIQKLSPLELMNSNPKKEDTLKEKTVENDDLLSTPETVSSVEYSFAEEHFAGEYNPSLDYEKLFSSEPKKSAPTQDDEYETSSDAKAETMSMGEAEEMTGRYQSAVVLGALGDISYLERRRFATWADFNPVERELFHKQYAMTGDVNYSRMF